MGPIAQATINIVSSHPTVLLQKLNNTDAVLAFNNSEDPAVVVQKIKAEAIDAYFRGHDVPLEGTGMKMVLEAEKNNIDWRLLPAIAMRESTGGKFACKNASHNFFGWGSCKINFNSDEEAIEVVAKNLGGNNPNTARHYSDKTTVQILRAYNPPSIVLRYAEQVMKIMDSIGDAEISIGLTGPVAA